ncbi:hypothetical protein Tco_0861909 [Tanacetum coccineum]
MDEWHEGKEDDDITMLVKSILDGSALGSFVQGGGDFLEEGTTGNTNIKQCLREVVDGHFTAAVKRWSEGTTYLDALCGEGSATATRSLTGHRLVREFVRESGVVPYLGRACCFSPHLTCLSINQIKGFEPIAVGNIRRRLVFQGCYESWVRKCQKYLSDFQLRGQSSVRELREGLFPVDVRSPSLGVKLLGGAVSRDADFISGLAMRKAANVVDLMSLLPQLHDPQSELLLLRSCMGIAKLFFGLRTCQPAYMEEAALFFDKGLCGSIKNIVVYGGPFFGDLQWSLASLPIRFVGLGLYSAKVVSFYAFLASRAQSWVLQDHILRDSGICGMGDDYVSALACLRDAIPSFDFNVFTNKETAPSKAQQTLTSALFSEMVKDIEVRFDMTVRQKAVFEFLRAPHAQDFLLAIPIDGLGQHMSPVEYRTILKYRLMILLFPVDAICPICRKACLDSFREHAVHCKELPGFKYRYDLVRDVLFNICRRAGISVRKEAPVNFLIDPSDGRSTLRPVEILVFGRVRGKHACVDLTGVSPLVGLSSRGFIVGQTALKATSCKVTKHEKSCVKNQHVFIPYVFDTFGFLAPEAVELLTRVQRVMNSYVMTPRSINVVFTRIGFAIQKGIAA